jgi:GcrA cell cycle regulator
MCAAPWTDERVETLQRLWAAGETAQSVAERLGGISRSAVMGKIFRLRRDVEPAPVAVPGPGDVADDSQPPARRRERRQQSAVEVSRPRRQARAGKNLLELTNATCRWPYGRPGTRAFFFCGAPGADLERGMPYCARHAQLAYRTGESVSEDETAASVAAGDLPPVQNRRQRAITSGG